MDTTETSASAAAATPTSSFVIDEWIKTGKTYQDVPHFVSLELQHRVATPAEARALLPDPSLPISGLLSAVFCQQIQTLQFVVPSSCFSEHPPNASFQDLLQRPIPNSDFLRRLRSHAGQAMLDGKCSIKDWTRAGIYLPFGALGFWYSLHEAATAKVAWQRASVWLASQDVPSNMKSRINDLLLKTQWSGTLSSLGSHTTVTGMAAFLSSEMLTESHVETMLSCLRVRIKNFHPTPSQIFIPTPTVGQGFLGVPQDTRLSYTEPTCLTELAFQLNDANHGPKEVWTVVHSPPIHFGAISITKSNNILRVQWGDSLRFPQPKKMINGIKKWASYHLPHVRLKFTQDLPCATQTDAFSCSVISINTLKHNLFGDERWTEKTREKIRIQEFLDILEYHFDNIVRLNFHNKSEYKLTLLLVSEPPPLARSSPGDYKKQSCTMPIRL